MTERASCEGFQGLGYSKNSNGEFYKVDGSGGALATLDIAHQRGHAGKRFIAEKFFAAVAKDATVVAHITTPATPVDAQYHIEVFHSVGATAYVNAFVDGSYGTQQVETATVVGTISTAGNASVVVTANGMTGSPKTIAVPVLLADDASAIAGKIRAALAADAAVAALFAVSGATDKVILTRLIKAANDGTLNIAIDNGTCAGITTAAASANTTAGVADAPGTEFASHNTMQIPGAPTTGAKCYFTPTPVANGTKIRDNGLIPAGFGPNALGGAGSARSEVILGAGQDLRVDYINKDSAGAKDIMIGFDWYEV